MADQEDVEASLRKAALRFKYNIDQLAKKYEKLERETEVSIELDCDTNEIIQLVKPGKKRKTDRYVYGQFGETCFASDMVFSCPYVDEIDDPVIKRKVKKHNQSFEDYFVEIEQRRREGRRLFDSDEEGSAGTAYSERDEDDLDEDIERIEQELEKHKSLAAGNAESNDPNKDGPGNAVSHVPVVVDQRKDSPPKRKYTKRANIPRPEEATTSADYQCSKKPDEGDLNVDIERVEQELEKQKTLTDENRVPHVQNKDEQAEIDCHKPALDEQPKGIPPKRKYKKRVKVPLADNQYSKKLRPRISRPDLPSPSL